MGKLSGPISDRIRGDLKGKVDINPPRGDAEKQKVNTPHDGHRMGAGPNRKGGK